MIGEDVISHVESIWKSSTNFEDDQKDFIYLARLGLWAREHGIPALEFYKSQKSREGGVLVERTAWDDGNQAFKALTALPKEND